MSCNKGLNHVFNEKCIQNLNFSLATNDILIYTLLSIIDENSLSLPLSLGL